MKSKKKENPIEHVLAAAQSVFVELLEIQLKELEEIIKDMRKRCDEGWEAMERVHERLGLYDRAKK